MNQIVMIPLAELHPHPDNPRKDLGDLTELTESIKESGLLQNLTVVRGRYLTPEEWREEAMRKISGVTAEDAGATYDAHYAYQGGYTVIIGHRRCEAARLAGLGTVPCVIVDMDYKTQLATMLAENIQRVDLTPFEQAQGMQLMMDLGVTVDEIAEKTGFAPTTVRRRLKIAELDLSKIKADRECVISLRDVERVAAIESESDRERLMGELGTRNFYYDIEGTETRQRRAKLDKKITADFAERYPELEKTFATNIGKSQWNQYWLLRSEPYSSSGMEIPKGATVWACDTNGDGCTATIYFGGVNKKREQKESPEKEAEEKRRFEIANEMREYVNAIDKAAYEKRLAFVKRTVHSLIPLLKAKAADILTLLGRTFYEGLNWQNKKTFASVIDADFEGKNYNEYNQVVYDATWDMHPLAVAAAAVYANLEPGDGGHHTCWNYNAGSYYTFKRNEVLDRCYEWLTLLGYQKDEDEMRMEDPDDRMYSFEHFAQEHDAADRGGS